MKNSETLPYPINRLPRCLSQSAPHPIYASLIFAWALVCLPGVLVAQETDSAELHEIKNSLRLDASVNAQTQAADIVPPLEGARERIMNERIEQWLQEARAAALRKDYKQAEPLYLQVLSFDIPAAKRREVLLEMAKFFETTHEPAKQAAVLEKFCDSFPDDSEAPQVFIRLGMLYRDLGLYKLALARFYSVLNFSLRIDQSKIESYKKLSIRAQMEIADTHFVMGSYSDAIKFYSKLRLLDLEPEERAHAIFQTAYCQYLLKNYADAVPLYGTFVQDYPQDSRLAEAMFLIADSYVRMGKHAEATETVLKLLKHQKDVTTRDKDEKEWIKWQKKAGNELANDLFDQCDYAGALSLYQAMLPLGVEPEWCWPVLYQMGVCFEHLSMNAKAQEMYKLIIEWPDRDGSRTDALKNKSLAETYNMAQWRTQNIDWKTDTNKKLEKLLDKSQ